jgi:hypothetical protein
MIRAGVRLNWRQRLGMAAVTAAAIPVGLVLVSAIIPGLRDEHVLRQRGVVTSGTIVAVYQHRYATTVRVRYTTATGKPALVTVDDATSAPRMAPGAPIRIRYDPDAPDNRAEDAANGAELVDELRDDAFGIAGIVLALGLILVGGFCVRLQFE